MSAEEFLIGLVLFLLSLAPLALGAVRLRNRLVPAWTGAAARLAECVIAIAALLGTGQLLGAIGLFRRGVIVPACVVVGLSMAAAGRGRAEPERRDHPPRPSVVSVVVAVAVVALVFGQWTVRTSAAVADGITNQDSLTYHLPHAARFVQESWTTHIHYVTADFPDAFHPSNTELVHAFGMLMFRRDVLSPILNLGWLLLLLLAAWCVGRPFGLGPATLVGASILPASPLMSLQSAGAATNDPAAFFFFLAVVAFLVKQERERAAVVLAGVAAGLAVGTKLTTVVPVVALTLGLFVIAKRRERGALLLTWLVPLLAAGSYWYLRNLVATGSPAPSVPLGAGPSPFPSPRFLIVERFGYSVAHYLGDGRVLREWIVPGMSHDLGPGWWLTLVLVAAGVVLSLSSGTAFSRMMGIVVIITGVAYLLSPTTALGPEGRPILFAGNFIYLGPALIVAPVLLVIAPVVRRPRRASAVLALLSVALLISQFATTVPAWPARFRTTGLAVTAAIGGAALAAAGVRWLRRTRGLPSLTSPLAAALTAAVVTAAVLAFAGGSYGTARRYLDDRYQGDALWRWAQPLTDQRIAIAGFGPQYPFYGLRLQNHVQYVGDKEAHGEFTSMPSCAAWRSALRRGRYTYVILKPERITTNVRRREIPWTRSDPAAQPFLVVSGAEVFRFDPSVPDPGCPSAA